MEIKKLDQNNFSLVREARGKVFVEFFASWCSPCKTMSVVLDRAAEDSEIAIYKVDVDESRALAEEFCIMSVPTMIVFEGGKEISRATGVLKSRELSEMLKA